MACPPLHLETSKNSQAQDASQVVWKLDTSALLPLAKYFLLRISIAKFDCLQIVFQRLFEQNGIYTQTFKSRSSGFCSGDFFRSVYSLQQPKIARTCQRPSRRCSRGTRPASFRTILCAVGFELGFARDRHQET